MQRQGHLLVQIAYRQQLLRHILRSNFCVIECPGFEDYDAEA